MRNRSGENGQVIVLVLMSMGLLLGVLALAIDVGVLFRAKRNVQIAADAAAFAGALDYYYNASNATAISRGTASGVANGVTTSQITVNSPPTYGPNAGKAGFVEAIVIQPNNTLFMGYLSGISSINVTARAVAGAPGASQACIYISNPTASSALDLQGAYDIEAPGCGVYVNSNSGSAVNVTGNGGTLNAGSFDIVGGLTGHQTNPTAPSTYSAPQSDPFGGLSGPNPATDCTGANTVSVATVKTTTAIPVSNGITCFSSTNVTLSGGLALPGGAIYVFENGVTVGGTMSVGNSSSGATMDVYSGTFNQGNSVLSIYAPTSGTYNGIALMQPVTNTNELQVQFGSGNQTLDGFIYAPGAEVYLQDHGGGITATGIVANTMFDKASTITIPSYSVAHPITTPLKKVTLVE
jgi:Flp pilus assembly protein TadG